MTPKTSNDYKKPIQPQAPEEAPKPSYLASLFKSPTDPKEAEAERAKLFGRSVQTTSNNGSFTL